MERELFFWLGVVLGVCLGASIAFVAQQIESRAAFKRMEKFVSEITRQTDQTSN